MIGHASLVIGRDLGEHLRVEPAGAGQRGAAGDRRRLARQRAAEPGADRRHEAHFRAVENILRQEGLHRLLHEIFAAIAANALGHRQAGGKFDQPMVEQRLARLQADGHAHPVALGQDVAGQPDADIGILGAIERIARRGIGHRLDIAILGAIGAQSALHVLAEETLTQRMGRDPDRGGIGLATVAGQFEEGRFGAQRARRPVGLGIIAAQRPEQGFAHRRGDQAAQPFPLHLEAVAAIAGKRLVRAVAGQGHRHLLARQFADPVGRQRGGIGKGLVEMEGQRVGQSIIIG